VLSEALKQLVEQALRATVPDLVRQVLREQTASSPPSPSDDGFFTTAEAAEWARVNPATIRQWIKVGRLERFRAGRSLRVSRSELRTFLEKGTCQTGEAESLGVDELTDQITKSL